MNSEIKREKKVEEFGMGKRLQISLTLPDLCSVSIKEKLSNARLGPGTYNVSSNTFAGPSYQFSQSLRFKDSDPFAKYVHISRKSSSINLQLPEVNLDIFRPRFKESKLKEDALKLSSRLLNTKTNKKLLLEDKRKKLLESLKEKSLKYELRQKVREFKALSGILQVFLVVLTVNCKIGVGLWGLIQKKKRVLAIFRQFRIACMAVGKFKRTLRKIRTFKSYRTLKKYAVHVRQWIKKRKHRYRQLINNCVERYSSKPLIAQSIVKLHVTIKSIQKAWKLALACKKSTLKAKLQIFRRLEIATINGKNKYFNRIPKSLITKELLAYKKKRLREYLHKIQKYKKLCEAISKKNLKNSLKFGMNCKSHPVKVEQYPPRPIPHYSLKKSKYTELIIHLQNRKSQSLSRISF